MGAAQAEGDLRQRRSGRDKDGHLERRFASQSPERPFRHQMKLKSSLFFITACFDMGEELQLWARTPSDRGARTNESYALRCIVRIENRKTALGEPLPFRRDAGGQVSYPNLPFTPLKVSGRLSGFVSRTPLIVWITTNALSASGVAATVSQATRANILPSACF